MIASSTQGGEEMNYKIRCPYCSHINQIPYRIGTIYCEQCGKPIAHHDESSVTTGYLEIRYNGTYPISTVREEK